MGIKSSSITFGEGAGGDGAAEAVRAIPLRLLVYANLRGGGRAEPRVHRVDKDSFDALFDAMKPALKFEAPNRLLAGGRDLTIELKFAGMKDFESRAVAGRIPAIKALLDIQSEVHAKAESLGSPRALADWAADRTGDDALARGLVDAIESAGGGSSAPAAAPAAKPAPAPSSTGGDGLDSILDMVDVGDDTPPATSDASSAVDSAVSAILGPGKKKGGSQAAMARAVQAADDWFDRRIGPQLDEVLHHPEFQSLESAWRGLRFLVSRTDFRQEIVVEALAGAKGDIRPVLLDSILNDEYETQPDPPIAAILCDVDFEASNPDIELLNDMSVRAEQVQAPIVGWAGAAYFGVDRLEFKGSLRDKLGGERYIKWRALRDKPESRWISLTVNRTLARTPWSAGAPGGAFTETCDPGTGEGMLWSSGVWAVGACITRSFAQRGWPHFISGMREGGLIEDLPIRELSSGGKDRQFPLECLLNDTHVQELAGAGLIPLQGGLDSDRAYLTYVPSVAAPKRFEEVAATQEAAVHSILPYQLFAGRMAQFIMIFLGEARGEPAAEAIQAKLRAKLAGVLGQPGEEKALPWIRVEVSDHDEDPALYQVCLELVPEFKFFGVSPRIQMAVGLRK